MSILGLEWLDKQIAALDDINRNVVMAHRLFVPLRTDRVFVAIGALHLYGEQGLLALLRQQGYQVRRVD
jgi:uncharacterized protein